MRLMNGKAWTAASALALVVGLPVDLVNLFQILRVRTSEPPGQPIVFEDFQVTSLPDCAFEAAFQEEGEPASVLNMFDWVLGIGPAEESAYAKAEYKIWKNLAGGGRSSVEVSSFVRGYSSEEMTKIHRELVNERGLQYIRKKFFFDENGYRAKVVMGRPRGLSSETQYSGCSVDPDQGRSEYLTRSVAFTCENLEEVLARQIERITSSDTRERCWVSYGYATNYQTGRLKFNEEYFVRNQEEVFDAGWPGL